MPRRSKQTETNSHIADTNTALSPTAEYNNWWNHFLEKKHQSYKCDCKYWPGCVINVWQEVSLWHYRTVRHQCPADEVLLWRSRTKTHARHRQPIHPPKHRHESVDIIKSRHRFKYYKCGNITRITRSLMWKESHSTAREDLHSWQIYKRQLVPL